VGGERHARLKALFHGALERDGAARADWLAQACGGDAGLRAEVDALLAAHFEAPTDFLSGPGPVAPAMPGVDPEQLGRERGWRVIRPLGRGGMGVVYLGERADGAYTQQVAIKLLDPALVPDREAVLRLQLERRILAQLNHPNIARLLDGGAAASGAPYLVMEYVEGERLDRWCEARGLDARARVALFLKVCEAVAYAHRNLVVHRDLKPDNILVTPEGEPKLLDFGIARLLGEDTGLTQEAGARLTPRYASPEQVRGGSTSTLSDVYSLGVVLYELLCGQSPYAGAVASGPQLGHAIAEVEPLPPSQRVAPDSAAGRARGELRGDLDAVVLRCLRKEPEARYAGVEALAADLQSWLERRPVTARRGGRLYRWRRFARRHWLALAAAAAVLVLSVAFVFELARQLEATRIERDKNARTLAFVTDLFRVVDPSEARGSSVTVREVLDRGAELLQGDTGLEAPVRQSLRSTIGAVYRQLGLYTRAEAMLQQAHADSTAAPGRERAAVQVLLAALRTDQGRYDEALALLDEADAALRGDPQAPAELRSRERYQRGELALRQGRFAEAEAPLREALALRRRLHGEPSREVAEALTALASVERDRGHLDQAQESYARALAMLEARNTDPWSRAKLKNNLAVVAGDRGDFAGAEVHMREALELLRAAVGDDHVLVAVGLGNVGSMLSRRGAHAEAEPLLARAHEIRRAQLGEAHPLTGTALSNLAYGQFALGRFEAAQEQFERALAVQEAGFGGGHLHTLGTLRNLAALAFARGDLAGARRWNQRLQAQGLPTLGGEHPFLLQAQVRLAVLECLEQPCAIPALREAVAAHEARLGAAHGEVGESLAALAAVERLQGDVAACATAARAEQALAAQAAPGHWDRQLAAAVLAACGGGDEKAALAPLRERFGAAHPWLRRWATVTPLPR
jgi:tetratricopeptide (TPR) repeat protein/predicted Ser/Thr protein kinase